MCRCGQPTDCAWDVINRFRELLAIPSDLKGDYAAARAHLQKAIEVAPGGQKNRALRTMAVSYAFEKNSEDAEKYEKQVFDALIAKSDFEPAAGVANEVARIKLESGDIVALDRGLKRRAFSLYEL